MFDNLLIHPESLVALKRFIAHPNHAILIEGPAHIGKSLIAREISANLLDVAVEKLSNSAMYRELTVDNTSIGIEQVRELFQFFSLKTLGNNSIQRVVVIPDAELMNHTAQNALLKLLEEPPADAVILLTSSVAHKLLPTITSRTQRLVIRKPTTEVVKQYFAKSYSTDEISRAIVLGEGRIGAVSALLTNEPDENAIEFNEVKRILSLSLFDQLILVETDLKDKARAANFVDQLAQISSASLLQTSGNPKAATQWQRISNAAYTASKALTQNANAKLVMTELMLSLRD